MAIRVDESLTVGADNIFAGVAPAAVTCMITVAASQGTLKRGSLISETGKLMATEETGKPAYILSDDVDTTAETVALAYRTGHFRQDKLIVADGYTITDADKEALRGKGILLSDGI